ncbi:Rossmann-like and DUF2520 domain-containing protein [Flavobacterium psychrotolerans]|uniref:DUF2520 domain-containing protein n=1 Tax=Flavobacterium psychrotolerans TaxID=2169410 RepID=A0A2U1JI22_9FLAO|nr:DUF2520 domain-containing protein [Flavobacterium psychrotolerans]PWA04777.1 DUF2520 domain-containing protein [Flavobacterium psychrotolerans]
MIRVSIIGSGNVAQHLIAAFLKAQNVGTEIELVQVYSRQIESVSHLLDLDKITNNFDALKEVDLYIILVSDDAIATVSSQLPFKNRLVAHTSGSIAIDVLNSDNRKGVFYPLQTFSKNKPIDFSSIPICLESQNATDFQLLEKVAKTISNQLFAINSEQRKALHVAAVFVNNFVNHLYQIGQEICQENQVPFEILKPLIKETAEKVMTLSPKEAQTGPAKRQDLETINAHLEFISDENHKKIYEILTQSIRTDGKKL